MSAAMMEREWAALTTEEYILVKHCGFTRSDVSEMFAEERHKYISCLKEEREQEAKQAQSARPSRNQSIQGRG